ncbi:MAG: hypothetical protein M3O46_01305, partial [Myxococcota bacterium]|nr:hypothetical protein [Myxococcota bacterium]
MTDDKKDPDDIGDIDWDRALSEWENTSFVPEVAKDVVTDKPAALAGSTRPLYRPPTVSPAVRPKGRAAPPVPEVPRWSPDLEEEEEEEDASDATRIQQVPEELLHSHGEGEGAATTPAGSAFVPPLSTQSDDDEIESASLLDEIEQAEEAK